MKYTGKETGRQTDNQTNRQTSLHTESETDRQTRWQTIKNPHSPKNGMEREKWENQRTRSDKGKGVRGRSKERHGDGRSRVWGGG